MSGSRRISSSAVRAEVLDEPEVAGPDARASEPAGPADAGWVADGDDLMQRVARVCATTDWEGHLPAGAASWRWRFGQAAKRGIDVVLAAAGVIVLAPLLLLLAVLVKLTSRGPVLYAFTALGHRGEPFVCYKFRTMTLDAHERKRELLHLNEMTGPAFKMREDPRVTPLGRILRKSSLDELPQLWNVLRGEMSLVGPRPPLPEEFIQYEPWHRGRLAVIPGMTCIWQVLGRNEIRDFDRWMELDRQYIRTWSLGLDAMLLLKTIPAVFRGTGAY
ncbi:MAG TPA: sugar transferase [Longimicrobiales bacterium]|nr:sugar transferase [Longimicrobiales bacterium]